MKRKGSIMAVSDQFCLRWNDHQSTLLTTFDTLLDSQKLTDVTLWAGGKCLKAHKVVLSACSPYFDKMLEAHDEKNPIIVFNDLSYEQLRAMLEYMYRGEVNVSQEQLDSFLKVAESLKIKGLTDQGGGSDIKGGGSKKKPLPPAPVAKERESPNVKRKRHNRRGSESGAESFEDEIKSDSGTGSLLQPKVELTEDNPGSGVGVEDLTMMEEEDDEDYYHHQNTPGSSRLADEGAVPTPHPPPDIKDFSSWDMTNDGFIGAQEMSGNNALNSSQADMGASVTVIVLEEGTVLQDGTVLPDGTVIEEGTVLQEGTVLEEGTVEDGTANDEGGILRHNGQEITIDKEGTTVVKEEIVNNNTLCKRCNSEFHQWVDFEKHREKCQETRYYCLMCRAQFDSENELRRHSLQHATSIRPTCKTCRKQFQDYTSFLTHKKIKCEKKLSITCLMCEETFQEKDQLNVHILESHSEPSVLESGNPSNNSTSEEKRYQCSLCPRSFTRCGSLNYHVSRKHSGVNLEKNPLEFPHCCSDCGNRYKSGTQLCRHRRWECGKEPMFKCQLCVKKFHHRHGLKQHMRLHLLKKGSAAKTTHYCCERCGRGYKLKSSLNNHIRWECGKEPHFSCESCNVKFTHKGNLKKHVLAKHAEKTDPLA